MAYGELIIYWADGTIQTYSIEKDIASIGRAPGNDLVLPTSAASRYHAHVKVGEQGEVMLVDLGTVNGTFVNDELLQPDASFVLRGGEEIRIGDVRLVFRAAEPAPAQVETQAEESEPDDTQAIPSTPGDLLVTLEEPHQAVAPGARMQLALTLENLGSEARTCEVELSGMDSKWARANRREVLLDGKEKTEVLISVRPPRSPDTPPGRYELVVRVTPHDETGQPIEHTRLIDIVGYHGLSMAVHPTDRPGTFSVQVQNEGNVSANIQLEGWHPQRALRYEFSESRFALGPGESGQATLQVRPWGRRSLGPTTFAVVAHSLDVSGYQAAVPALYRGSGGGGAGLSVPLVGVLAPLLLVGTLTAAVAVLAAALVILRGSLLTVSEASGRATAAPESADAETPALAPTPTRFPAPSSVEVSFDPDEVVRYQDTPVLLRYAVETGPGLGPEEMSLELYDEPGQRSLARFTVADFDGEVDLTVLLGPEWLPSVYQDNASPSYSLRVSARGSPQASSPPATLTVHELTCSVSSGPPARAGPGLDYPPADPPLQPGLSYWPTAQALSDGHLWYQVQPGRTQRWLEADRLVCTKAGQNWQPEPGFRFIEAKDTPPLPPS